MALVVAIGLMSVLSLRAFRGIRIDPASFDFPARAVNLLDQSGAEGNLIVDFDWGEYVIWRLGDRIKVSIDGRRETVYSAETLQRDTGFRDGKPGWQSWLGRGKPELALLRRGSASERLMRQQPGWTRIDEDHLGALFIRDGAISRCRIIRELARASDRGSAETWFPATFPR